jgi:hypothetical protein
MDEVDTPGMGRQHQHRTALHPVQKTRLQTCSLQFEKTGARGGMIALHAERMKRMLPNHNQPPVRTKY